MFLSLQENTDFESALEITKEAVIGDVIAKKEREITFDIINSEIVINDSILKEKSNLATIGNAIVKLRKVELIGNYQYKLFLEESALCGMFGQRFILIDENVKELKLPTHLAGKKLFGKIISDGGSIASASAV